MNPGPRSTRGVFRASGSLVAAAMLASCTTGATEVLVQIDSDLAPGRAATLDVYVTNGQSPQPSMPTRSWSTDALDGGLVLPASFGVVPPHDGPRDGSVELLVELHVAAGGPNEPAVTLRRRARFRFTPQRPLAVPVFLPIACGTIATGCTTVATEACTLATRCEELGMTCGNEARCVPIDTVPVAVPAGDASTIEIAPGDAFTPPPPPRPIAPMSNTALTAGSVVFTYALPSGTDGARIELCSSRTCDTVVRSIDADGSSSAPIADLTPGLHWYRLRSRAEGALGPPGIAWPFHALAAGANTARHAFTVLDVDGDGFSDTAVGNPMAARVDVYRGSATGLGTTPSPSVRDPSNVSFGSAIASAGDVNGDGFADLVVSAPSNNRVMIFHGSESGIAATPTSVLPGNGEQFTDGFGYDVAGAGDVDGDGYADLIVGTAFVSTALLYRGSASGIVTPAAAVLRAPDLNARFGTAVAGAGDVNGDGFADLLIGAWGQPMLHGTAYVFQGSAAGIVTTPWATMQGNMPDDNFGGDVSAAGDVDADGFADLVVGSAGIDRATVFHGGAAALSPTQQVLRPPPAIMQYARFAISNAPAGDFDGDGFADVAVGAQDLSRVYVFRGGASGVEAIPSYTLAASPGSNGAGLGRIVGQGGDCNGDHRGDLIVGCTTGTSAWAYYGRAPATGDIAADRFWTGTTNFGFTVAR